MPVLIDALKKKGVRFDDLSFSDGEIPTRVSRLQFPAIITIRNRSPCVWHKEAVFGF